MTTKKKQSINLTSSKILNTKIKQIHKKLKVKSTTDNLSRIRDFIHQTAMECKLPKEKIGDIILAVDEACTNVIKHAYKYSPEGEIDIDIKCKNNRFYVIITDKGEKFDITLIPEPDLEKYHKEKRVGGLGIFLMRKLMDEVKYSHLSGNRNRVTLIKYL